MFWSMVCAFLRCRGRDLVPEVRRWSEADLASPHGGPGVDHSIYKPAYSAFADIAQVHLPGPSGNGEAKLSQGGVDPGAVGDDYARSANVPLASQSDRAGLSLRHVAMAYANAPSGPSRKACSHQHRGRRRSHRERRVQCSTLWRPEVGALARRRFLRNTSRTRPRSTNGEDWRCRSTPAPRATRTSRCADRPAGSPALVHAAGGEGLSFDMLADFTASSARPCRRGEDDPMTPIECQADIAAAYRPILCSSNGLRMRARGGPRAPQRAKGGDTRFHCSVSSLPRGTLEHPAAVGR